MSGRSSPEYKDNEPGSIYAPNRGGALVVPNTADTPNDDNNDNNNNNGHFHHLRAHFDDTDDTAHESSQYSYTSNSNSHSSSQLYGQEDSSSPYPQFGPVSSAAATPYVPTSIYDASGSSTPAATPFRSAKYFSATPEGALLSTGDLSVPYKGYSGVYSSNHGVGGLGGGRLTFDPEGAEEGAGPSCSSADTSFDCEMVFTAIYSNSSPQHTKAATSADSSSSSTAATTAAVGQSDPQAVDEEVFEGENKHFKSTLLDVKSLQLAPDAPWAGQKRRGFVYDRTGNDSPPAGPAAGSFSSAGSASASAPLFELGAEDAMKLGEVGVFLAWIWYCLLSFIVWSVLIHNHVGIIRRFCDA